MPRTRPSRSGSDHDGSASDLSHLEAPSGALTRPSLSDIMSTLNAAYTRYRHTSGRLIPGVTRRGHEQASVTGGAAWLPGGPIVVAESASAAPSRQTDAGSFLTSLDPVVLRYISKCPRTGLTRNSYQCQVVPVIEFNACGQIVGLSSVALETTNTADSTGEHPYDSRGQGLIQTEFSKIVARLVERRGDSGPSRKEDGAGEIIKEMKNIITERLECRVDESGGSPHQEVEIGYWTAEEIPWKEAFLTAGKPYWVRSAEDRDIENPATQNRSLVIFGHDGDKASLVLTRADFTSPGLANTHGEDTRWMVQGAYLTEDKDISSVQFSPLAYQDTGVTRSLLEETYPDVEVKGSRDELALELGGALILVQMSRPKQGDLETRSSDLEQWVAEALTELDRHPPSAQSQTPTRGTQLRELVPPYDPFGRPIGSEARPEGSAGRVFSLEVVRNRH